MLHLNCSQSQGDLNSLYTFTVNFEKGHLKTKTRSLYKIMNIPIANFVYYNFVYKNEVMVMTKKGCGTIYHTH